jgi:hypothetical protein
MEKLANKETIWRILCTILHYEIANLFYYLNARFMHAHAAESTSWIDHWLKFKITEQLLVSHKFY